MGRMRDVGPIAADPAQSCARRRTPEPPDRPGQLGQLNESPQAHEPVALGLLDREALLLDGVDKVDGGAAKVRNAHTIDHEVEALVAENVVTFEVAVVEEELVAQTRTSAGLNGDPQRQVGTTLLLQQGLDLGGRGVGE